MLISTRSLSFTVAKLCYTLIFARRFRLLFQSTSLQGWWLKRKLRKKNRRKMQKVASVVSVVPVGLTGFTLCFCLDHKICVGCDVDKKKERKWMHRAPVLLWGLPWLLLLTSTSKANGRCWSEVCSVDWSTWWFPVTFYVEWSPGMQTEIFVFTVILKLLRYIVACRERREAIMSVWLLS